MIAPIHSITLNTIEFFNRCSKFTPIGYEQCTRQAGHDGSCAHPSLNEKIKDALGKPGEIEKLYNRIATGHHTAEIDVSGHPLTEVAGENDKGHLPAPTKPPEPVPEMYRDGREIWKSSDGSIFRYNAGQSKWIMIIEGKK